MLPARDGHLVQIVEAAAADSIQRSGKWLACGPGCTQCCIGVFPITQLDGARLRAGLSALEVSDAGRAVAVKERAREAVARLAGEYPGNPRTGVLDPTRAEEFEEFANDEPCPALDPASGLCDLYAARPITCRVFGHPVRTTEGIGVCELCFAGASPEEIAAGTLDADVDGLESALNAEVERTAGPTGSTIVAWALAEHEKF